jgi:tetratricopeptide (TPR) repeat protein
MTDLNRRGLLTGGRAAKAAPAATATLPGTYNIRLEQREYTVGNGVPMGGYGWGEDRRSTGVTPGRPMKMACVVLQSGTDSPIVLVRIDVVSIPRHVYDDIKGKLRVQGLIASYAHLVIAQSHTHHGPMVGTIPDPYVLLGSRDAVAVTNAYTTSFIDQVVNLVRSTVTGARTEVTLGYAEAGAYIAMNREDLIWAPREVPILVARNTTGDKKPYALLFGHACHPVCQARSSTLDTDYCGQAAAKIEQELAVPALFFQGTAGDLVPVVSGDEAAVVSNGNQVADAVVGMVRANSLIPVSGPISARLESIQLPFVVNTGTDEGREELRVKYDGRVRLPPERPSDPEVAAIRHAERMLDLIKDQRVLNGDPLAGPGPAGRDQLPPDIGHFIGRTEVIGRLTDLLVSDGNGTALPIVTLVGPPGVGKTALAVHVAHQLRDAFPDGRLLVDLRGYARRPPMTAGQALTQFLRTLGVPAEQVPLDVEEQSILFRAMLSGKRVLVVLDNAAGAEQVRALLPAHSGSAVLITSRNELRGLAVTHGARQVTLAVFGVTEARDLLGDLLGAGRVSAEPGAVSELAELCAYLPLALSIAAANAAAQSPGSIADYVTELAQGSRLTTLAVDEDDQAAVSTAFDLSYAALKPEARRLFRLLGVAPGPDFTAETAAVIADAGLAEAKELLRRLATGHLVQRRPAGRYQFHDLLRLYAAEQSEEDERETALLKLLHWYLGTVHNAADILCPEIVRMADDRPPGRGFADHNHALAWLRAERMNLIAAVRHAAEHGPLPLAWQLTDALRGYFWIQSDGTDWQIAAKVALKAATTAGDERAQSAMQHSLGTLYASISDHPRAVEHYEHALRIARRAGLPAAQAAALNNLGIVRQDQGELDHAVRHYEQAQVIQQASADQAALATTMVNLGSAHWELGHIGRARLLFERARLIVRDAPSWQARVEVLDSLARVHLDQGDLDSATECARQALRLAEETGHPRQVAEAHNTLGTISLRRGSWPQSLAHHEEALRVTRDIGYQRAEVAALLGLANVRIVQDRPADALPLCEQALVLVNRAGFQVRLGRVLTTLARARLALGDYHQAAAQAQAALGVHRETGHRVGEARALWVLGDVSARLDDPAAARLYWDAALRLFDELGAPEAADLRSNLQGSPGRPPSSSEGKAGESRILDHWASASGRNH